MVSSGWLFRSAGGNHDRHPLTGCHIFRMTALSSEQRGAFFIAARQAVLLGKLTTMRGLAFILSVFSLCAIAADQGQKGKRPPDVTVVEAKAHRIEDKISVDGKVKITAEKPLKGLVLAFDFLDHDNGVLTTGKDEISDDTLRSGESPSFRSEIVNPPGAIKFKIRAFDAGDKELRIANPGPFIIE
jgi:hypothetical protein